MLPDVKTKTVELLSVYGVLVNPKTGTRNDRDGTVTVQAFAGLLHCFDLKSERGTTFVDGLHNAVVSQYASHRCVRLHHRYYAI